MNIALLTRIKELEAQVSGLMQRVEQLEKPKKRGPGRPRKDDRTTDRISA